MYNELVVPVAAIAVVWRTNLQTSPPSVPSRKGATMKKLACLAIVLLGILSLAGCGKAALPAQLTIRPGNRIGDFLITTGDDDASPLAASDCKQEGASLKTCSVSTSRKVNVSYGIYDDSRTAKLSALWLNQRYEMLIEGHPVNLQAFGSTDVYQPTIGTMRRWNVVVVASKPGKITIHHSAVVGSEHAEGTVTLVFYSP